MADFIISPYAISYTNIKNALQNYVKNKTDLKTKWTDFYTSGAGQTILELDAAVAAFYAFHFIIGRREAFLTVAQNYSSIVGGALALGYNVSRGHNVYLEIEVTPEKTQSLAKWTVIGSYAEYDVVLLEDVILNAGTQTKIKCVIGNTSAQTITMTSSELQQFVFTAENTTDDCRLILNNVEVPHSTELKDAMNDKYIMLTNPYGSVDVFYLNNGLYKYTTSDVLYLQFIERNNLKFSDIQPQNITIDFAEQVDNITKLAERLDKEDPEHARLAAPIYHETNNVVRARKDYVKYLKQNNDFILDAADKDLNPGLIALTYIKKTTEDDPSPLLTSYQKQEYIDNIMAACPDGVADAFIVDPIEVKRTLDIKLSQKSDELISATIEDDINEILETYKNKLQPSFDPQQLEHDIERLKGVKTARVGLGTTPYETNKEYKLYDVIRVTNIPVGTSFETWDLYCSKVNATTGSAQPDWNAAGSVGQKIVDNNIVWENSNKYADSVNLVWKPNMAFSQFANIKVSYSIGPSQTAETEPVWSGLAVTDGNVTWNRLKSYTPKLTERESNKKYLKDQQIIVKDNDEQIVYYVDSVTNKSGKTEPSWADAIEINDLIYDNAITWSLVYKPWIAETIYLPETEIAEVKDGIIYIYKASSGVSGTEKPNFDGSALVIDNTITWSIVNTYSLLDWAPETEFNYGVYTQGNNCVFKAVDIDNTMTGETVKFYNKKWLETVVDNNIIWKIDTYRITDTDYPAKGGYWQPATEMKVGDSIIVSDTLGSYLYQVAYTQEIPKTTDNVIYTVAAFGGQTGDIEPVWGEDNVIDNNILWTKTTADGFYQWYPFEQKQQGDIITTSEGNYIFASIVGKSGQKQPNWTSIENGKITDNNITWVKLSTVDETSRQVNENTIDLQWNEHLDLKAESPRII